MSIETILKLNSLDFQCSVMCKEADGTTNSVDPVQNAPQGAV